MAAVCRRADDAAIELGLCYDWMPTNTYEQTLRVDGIRQRELDIIDPEYPILFEAAGVVPPVNRYIWTDGLDLPLSKRFSLGIDQRVWRQLTATASYSYTRGSGLARGTNVNAPIEGLRPQPSFGNIIDVISDASSRVHQLQVKVTANPGALLPAFNAQLIRWTRTTLFANYSVATLESNTDADGAFAIPPSGNLDTEWGPAVGDVRHRLNVSLNNQIVRNLLLAVNVSASSGTPHSIRTGRDENGDLVFNDSDGRCRTKHGTRRRAIEREHLLRLHDRVRANPGRSARSHGDSGRRCGNRSELRAAAEVHCSAVRSSLEPDQPSELPGQ